jgi:hypothetical protein
MPTRNANKPVVTATNGTKAPAQQEEHQLAPAAEAVGSVESTEILRETAALARAGLEHTVGPRTALRFGEPAAPVQAASADVTDEVEKLGPAFGSFVKSVGLAVAEAQTALDKTLVDTAKALSDTKIDVIAIFEQQIDDNGTMQAGHPIVQQLPLVNYLMPTAYQWSRVYLQADMNVSEFNSANGFNIQSKSMAFNASARAGGGLFSGFSASGSTSFGISSSEVAGGSSYSQDVAAGKMHMEATLEPRADIQLPKPFVIQKGPQLKLMAGSLQDVIEETPDPNGGPSVKKLVGHKVTLTAELKATNGGPGKAKQLEISLSQPLTYTMTPTDGKTDDNGNLTIEITRQGAAFDPNKPLTLEVRVWLGLVAQAIAVTL